jgi:hypothetical protein
MVLHPALTSLALRSHRAFFIYLAETEGVAYIPQAAVWLASQTLRLPHVMHAGASLAPPKIKPPTGVGGFIFNTGGPETIAPLTRSVPGRPFYG